LIDKRDLRVLVTVHARAVVTPSNGRTLITSTPFYLEVVITFQPDIV
jgi:hypothetical protein